MDDISKREQMKVSLVPYLEEVLYQKFKVIFETGWLA